MLLFLREFSEILLKLYISMENSEINVAAVIEKLGFVRIGTNYYKMVEN